MIVRHNLIINVAYIPVQVQTITSQRMHQLTPGCPYLGVYFSLLLQNEFNVVSNDWGDGIMYNCYSDGKRSLVRKSNYLTSNTRIHTLTQSITAHAMAGNLDAGACCKENGTHL